MEPKDEEAAQPQISDPELNRGPAFSHLVAFVLTCSSLRNADNPTSPWPSAVLTGTLRCTTFHPTPWKDEKELGGDGTGWGWGRLLWPRKPHRDRSFVQDIGGEKWVGWCWRL